MKQNYKISLCALLLAGAVSMMTAGAQGSGKPTLAVFVVGNETIGGSLTTALGTNLTSGGRYAPTTVSISDKLAELKAAYTAGGGSSIDRNALAAWGRTNSIDAICLVVDDVKGSDHLFSAQLIDTKDSKLDGRGSYTRTGVSTGDVTRVALALAKQLEGPKRVARVSVAQQQKWFEPEMVHVKGGMFTMGCTPEQEAYCDAIEKPAHSVTVSDFSIGKYQITQAQWKAVMTGVAGSSVADAGEIYHWKGTNCGNIPCDDQRPADFMDWYEAVKFCNELSKKVGLKEAYEISGTTVTVTGKRGYRLPTEAEWEYAARGCKAGSCENFLYSGSNNADEVAWHDENSSGAPHPVGQKKPNGLGIYDMSGNLLEWCYDWYEEYSDVAATNPTGPNTGVDRVRRGGTWYAIPPNWHRVAARIRGNPPAARGTDLGFRIVLPAQ
jgi:formylglycine-generating enzyme required for sulfatase activity